MRQIVLGTIGVVAAIAVAVSNERYELSTARPTWLLVLGGAITLGGCLFLWRFRTLPGGPVKRVALLRTGGIPIFTGLALVSVALGLRALSFILTALSIGTVLLARVPKSSNRTQASRNEGSEIPG